MHNYISAPWKRFAKFQLKAQLSTLRGPPLTVYRRKDTEPMHRYEPGGYLRVFSGDLYHQYFQVVAQLGWGNNSTVWLVRDIRTQNLAALKILTAELTASNGGHDELGMLRSLRDGNSPGRPYVCQLLDDFVQQGIHGFHTCLVLEALSVSVAEIRQALTNAMPLPLVKRISKHVLRALEYAHESRIIHTDIKADNILMAGKPIVMGQHGAKLSMSDLMSATYKLADFGAAYYMSDRLADVIQPDKLRAPEVIIGAEWDTKTDIWNLGCLIFEFVRGNILFDPYWNLEKSGMNPEETHLAQIVGLLGEFPRELLHKGKRTQRFFDDQGHLLRGAGRYHITLLDLLSRTNHSPADMIEAADFLSRALVIDPTARWSAGRLSKHPWLADAK